MLNENDRLEKVIKGLELCRYDPDPGQECKQLVACDICPYWSDHMGCMMTEMFNDAITELKSRLNEPTKFQIKTTISNIDKPAGIDEEQFFAVMANVYYALARLYGEDIPVYSQSEEANA